MFYRPHKRVHPDLDLNDQITKQSMAKECDIDYILNQYQRTGVMTHVNPITPTYEDLPSEYDYQSAINTIMQAEAAFAELPAAVRDHFANDPARYLDAFNDENRADELRSLGLLKPAPAAPAAPPEPSPAVTP